MFKMTYKNTISSCFLALLFLTLFFARPSLAQNKCAALFNRSVGLQPIKEIDFTKTPEFKELQRSYPGLKPVGEYDQPTGTLVVHAGSLALDGFKYYQSLLAHLPPDVRTLLVGSATDYDSFVRFQFTNQARNTDAGPLDTFLKVQNETTPAGDQTPVSRWVKDHMGQFVTYQGWDNNPVVAMVTANYRFNYKVSDQLAKFFGVQIVKNISGNFEWGNFTVIGDTGYVIHGPRTHSDLNLQDLMMTGVSKLVLLPQPQFQNQKLGIPHVDEFLIPLSKEHLLTNVPEYLEYFRQQGKQAELLPSNADLGLDHLTYTNAVLVNGETTRVIFVPQFGSLTPNHMFWGKSLGVEAVKKLKERDKEALRIYKSMARKLKITVVPVYVAEFTLNNFGGIHCATGVCAAIPNPDQRASWYEKGDQDL